VGGDFSRAFLNQVELGKANPSTRVLRVIAGRLGTQVDYLLEGRLPQLDRELRLERARLLLLRGYARRALTALEGVTGNEWPLMTDVHLTQAEALMKLGKEQKAKELLDAERSVIYRHHDVHRRERLLAIEASTGIPLTQIYGVATFYAQFRLKPVGKHIVRVCHGTACHVAGANDISSAVQKHLGVADGETTEDRNFTVETVACLGCCSLAPVVMVDKATHGNLSPSSTVKVLKKYQKGERS
jgi:NADH-quinone oxidoreductase subunit E